MGATTVTRIYPAGSVEELKSHYREALDSMAREGGTDGYCGNWNSNSGLQVVTQVAKSEEEAEAYLEARMEKRGSVLAMRVGDFTKCFPESKADKTLVAKVAELEKSYLEFEWHILARAKSAKSRTRKCSHCESSINVQKIEAPTLKEFVDVESASYSIPGMFLRSQRRMNILLRGLCDCPVCGHNLLKTDTDNKAYKALQTKLDNFRKKKYVAEQEYNKKPRKGQAPCWVVTALCGS